MMYNRSELGRNFLKFGGGFMSELLIITFLFIGFILLLIGKYFIQNRNKPTILESILMLFLALQLVFSFLIWW